MMTNKLIAWDCVAGDAVTPDPTSPAKWRLADAQEMRPLTSLQPINSTRAAWHRAVLKERAVFDRLFALDCLILSAGDENSRGRFMIELHRELARNHDACTAAIRELALRDTRDASNEYTRA